MATQADLDLARRLLSANVVTQDEVRGALQIQADLLKQSKVVSLERILVAKRILAPEATRILSLPDPLLSQPFPGYRLRQVVGEGGRASSTRRPTSPTRPGWRSRS